MWVGPRGGGGWWEGGARNEGPADSLEEGAGGDGGGRGVLPYPMAGGRRQQRLWRWEGGRAGLESMIHMFPQTYII